MHLPNGLLNGLDTNVSVLKVAVSVAERAAALPEQARSLALDGVDSVEALWKLAHSAVSASDAAIEAFTTLADDDTIDNRLFFDGVAAGHVLFADAAARSKVCGSGTENLLAWCKWQRRFRGITAPEIKGFVEAGLAAGITPETLTATYRTFVRRQDRKSTRLNSSH